MASSARITVFSFGRRCGRVALALIVGGGLLAAARTTSAGTLVRFDTTSGQVYVDLTDNLTPKTVQNFLSYVNDHTWDNSFIHRSVPNFVVQGGGYLAQNGVPHVTQKPPVVNEFKKGVTLSNVRGTIAMAKIGGDPNSATSEWFFSVADNRSNLDSQNGGFTAFGEVIAGSMSVVDAIAALSRVNAGGSFTELPVHDFDGNNLGLDNLVKVNTVAVVPPPFRNPTNRFDENNDGKLTPQDVLNIIDKINATPNAADLRLGITFTGNQYYDVTGDSRISPQDVLAIIDEINRPKNLAVGATLGVVSVPEPASIALGGIAGVALLAAALYRQRYRRRLLNCRQHLA